MAQAWIVAPFIALWIDIMLFCGSLGRFCDVLAIISEKCSILWATKISCRVSTGNVNSSQALEEANFRIFDHKWAEE